MAIPSSGQVGLGTIRTELQNTGTNNFALSKAGSQAGLVRNQGYTPLNLSSTALPGATAPYSISEWRNYDHSANKLCASANPLIESPIIGAGYTYYRVLVTGSPGNYVSYGVQGVLIGSTQQLLVKVYQDVYPFTSTGSLITDTPAYQVTFENIIGTASASFSIDMVNTDEVHHIVMFDNSIL
jgi:hypothetical protein